MSAAATSGARAGGSQPRRQKRTSAGAPRRSAAAGRRAAPRSRASFERLREQAAEIREVTLHGHRVAYRAAGERGPVVLLIHGITSHSGTWETVMPMLAERHQVLAPDLFGHGASAKPRGDYSLGAFASGLRDLLSAVGHERASVVGHSLGGGVAMQFAYQFPASCERLILVDSGGLGREVTPLLRAATLPGAELVLPLLTHPRLLEAGAFAARALGALGLRAGTDLSEAARGHASLAELDARQAFIATLRTILDTGGQRVDARDRLYLATLLPTLIVWGERDHIIPVRHGREAHRLIPGSRFEEFPRAGHFPHVEEPHRFAALLEEFIESTEPNRHDVARWQRLLVDGASGGRAAGLRRSASTS